ncbi:MAG: ribosomal-protein-alanine N-acetyltransferase [Actinobacteria bacterium HGW-Actinobacteria-2]|nr:MAG: ribosomal-protein-alanine N-acetyltransferase [Actinobacteria bacterium HGW-Actinobacteria-2]
MIITHASAADLDGILALEQNGFDPAEQWSHALWADEIAAPDHLVLTNSDADGQLQGVATFTVAEDMADLQRVVVHPRARGRGVGSSLVRAGLEWAEALGANRMLLEVRTDNLAAVALYRRLGFDQISCRRDYYGPGRDAYVMLRPLGEDEDVWALSR